MPSTLRHVHCEVGTWGHNVHDDIRAAYNEWEDDHFAIVNKVNKGDRRGRVTDEGWAPSVHQLLPILTNVCVSFDELGCNPWTEQYSAIAAAVPDDTDCSTHVNRQLLDTLDSADQVYVCGEAASHCVRATVEHLAHHMRDKFVRVGNNS
jgi:nicotinamidase-related amidase